MNSTVKTSVVSLHHFKISNFIDKHKFTQLVYNIFTKLQQHVFTIVAGTNSIGKLNFMNKLELCLLLTSLKLNINHSNSIGELKNGQLTFPL